MNTGDWIALGAILIPGLGGLTAWLGRHAERLKETEVRITVMEKRQDDDTAWIRNTLQRIEDKLDRKADRP